MGNLLCSLIDRPRRPSEIHYDFFSRHYSSTQYPRNLSYPHDNEMYSITSKQTGEPFILKRVTFHSQESMDSFLSNLENVIEFQHPHLLKIENYFIDRNIIKDGVVSYSVNVILENFSHTLYHEMVLAQQEGSFFSEDRVKDFFIQTVSGLEFLHQRCLSHGSICPSNIYVTDDHKYKLCFLGETIYKTKVGLNPNFLGIMDYMQPKLRNNLVYSLCNGTYSNKIMGNKYKCDVFSLGVVLMQMISFADVQSLNLNGTENERLARLYDPKGNFSPRFLQIIERMLNEDETKIPSIYDIKGMIQIYQDDECEQSGMQNFFAHPQSFGAMKKTNIEMRLFEDKSGDKVNFNYGFENSMSEDLMENYSARYFGRKSFYENHEYSRSYDNCVPELHNDEITKSMTSLSDDQRKFDEDRQNSVESPTPFHAKRGGSFSYATEPCDEMLISNEEDLAKPMSHQIKKLVIRLGGQSQNENFGEGLAKFFEQQRSLQELGLTLPNMSLGDKQVITILQSLASLENLQVFYLELRKNKITEKSIPVLCEALRNKKNLTQLGIDLAGNAITKEGCKKLCAAFEELGNITSLALNIGGNQIGCEGLDGIIELISGLKSVENLVLFLFSNGIEAVPALKRLFESIDDLEKLRTLTIDLSDNHIADEGGEVILSFLRESCAEQVNVELVSNCISEKMKGKMRKGVSKLEHINLQV